MHHICSLLRARPPQPRTSEVVLISPKASAHPGDILVGYLLPRKTLLGTPRPLRGRVGPIPPGPTGHLAPQGPGAPPLLPSHSRTKSHAQHAGGAQRKRPAVE
eukprot:scaffold17115_cov109-Isochrysis_galbana.AAC.2